MRGGGFPCRSAGCDIRFAVAQSDSLPSLLEASARRTAHELEVHDYRHVTMAEEATARMPFQRPAAGKDRDARRR